MLKIREPFRREPIALFAILVTIGLSIGLFMWNRIDLSRQFEPEPVTFHVSNAGCISTARDDGSRALAFSLSLVNPGPQSAALLLRAASVGATGDIGSGFPMGGMTILGEMLSAGFPNTGLPIGELESLSLKELNSFFIQWNPPPGLNEAFIYGGGPFGVMSLVPRDVAVFTPVLLVNADFVQDPLGYISERDPLGYVSKLGAVPVFLEFEEVSAQEIRTHVVKLRIDPEFIVATQGFPEGWCFWSAVYLVEALSASEDERYKLFQ